MQQSTPRKTPGEYRKKGALRELAMNTRKKLSDIQKGDIVVRWLAGAVPMELVVTDVTAHRIICGPWEFCRLSGAEMDEELGFGPGCTCSYIEPCGQSPSN